MAFPIEIEFFGLCHLVDNAAKTAMCVVLPQAQHHEPKIKRKLGVIIRESDGVAVPEVGLKNARVELFLTGGQGGGNFNFKLQDGGTFAVVPFTELARSLWSLSPVGEARFRVRKINGQGRSGMLGRCHRPLGVALAGVYRPCRIGLSSTCPSIVSPVRSRQA